MNRGIISIVSISIFVLRSLSTLPAQSIDSPQTRLQPIGSPSLVDQFNSPVAQTAWMQAGPVPDGFSLPPSMAAPPASLPPAPIAPAPIAPPPGTPPMPIPPPNFPRALPSNPLSNPVPSQPAPFVPAQNPDYAPLGQPRLSNQFATLDNSCHVSGPSTYRAASASGCCAPVGFQTPPTFVAPLPTAPLQPAGPPTVVVPGQTLIPVGPPVAAPSTGVPSKSLISFGQDRNFVQVGPGLWGQPTAYVPGQKFRNWLRYLTP